MQRGDVLPPTRPAVYSVCAIRDNDHPGACNKQAKIGSCGDRSVCIIMYNQNGNERKNKINISKSYVPMYFICKLGHTQLIS